MYRYIDRITCTMIFIGLIFVEVEPLRLWQLIVVVSSIHYPYDCHRC